MSESRAKPRENEIRKLEDPFRSFIIQIKKKSRENGGHGGEEPATKSFKTFSQNSWT